MAKSDGSGSKRRRLAAFDDANNLADLSGDALAAIAEYLPKTSRALLAVALTAPPSSWRDRGWRGEPSDAGKAILAASLSSTPFETVLDMNISELKGSDLYKNWPEGLARDKIVHQRRFEEYYAGGWEVLDFLDLEPELASNLSDDDVGATLACIGAGSNLKKLYLTKCSSLVGGGLEPLRGSSALEHIDFNILHLVTCSHWGSAPKETCFSLETALSVLGSILAADGSALQRTRVPRSWIVPGKLNDRFMVFLAGHKHALNVSMALCYFGFEGSKEEFVIGYIISQQQATAGLCACGGGPPSGGRSTYTSCADCNLIMCGDIECRTEGEDARVCDQCNATTCLLCARKGEGSVKYCDSGACDNYCDNCRYISFRNGGNDCECCKDMVFDRLLQARQLQESTVQAAEMERLRAENERLRAENAELLRAQENGRHN